MAYFFWVRFRRDPPGVAIFFVLELLAALANFSFIFRLLDSSSLLSSSSPNEAAKGETERESMPV